MVLRDNEYMNIVIVMFTKPCSQDYRAFALWFALTIIHRSRKAAKTGKDWEHLSCESGGGKVGGVP